MARGEALPIVDRVGLGGGASGHEGVAYRCDPERSLLLVVQDED